MAPTIEAEDRVMSGHRLSHPPPGEEVLITGVSGYFPDSDSVLHLQENLFNKVDLVTSDNRRWKPDPEIPHRIGKINNVNKFDASFFGVHYKQAHTMDPMCRILLEKAYEAIYDAGVNPKELRSAKTGVFIGTSFSESEKALCYERENVNKYGMIGCSRAMLANRISYWLGVTGPSYTVDSACSSSLYALEHAFRAIRDGHCDSAIVGGSNLCLHPHLSLLLDKLGVLSPDGRCKSFDESANGYVRAEAVVVIFLQKAKDSRRAYMQIVHAKTNCDGFKNQGITYPSGEMQEQLLQEIYDECCVTPLMVEYVESHGTGTVVGDPEELSTFDKIFCTGRSGPLKVGSVKSNLGHAEAASGLVSITKMCIAYATGYIPPNMHYVTPRKQITALTENRIQVVTEKTPWNRGHSAVNNLGFGGANAHVVLNNFAKPKVNNGLPEDDLPRLVCVSGRTESAVTKILEDLETRTVDVEIVRLLHAIHDNDIQGHVFRGYVILGSSPEHALPLSRSVQYFSGVRRPVWFVYSGVGSQWPGMGAQLMRIPAFAAAIQKCHKTLEPKGVNLTDIITNTEPNIFDNIINLFIGNAAIQIGLTDVLKTVGIEPDYIIGHSVGELGCAYADGCLTAEQVMMAAYSRGRACTETPIIKGSMAAIGISSDKVKSMCPPEIEVSCSNGSSFSSISGPAEDIKSFVADITAQGIFAKEIVCGNIAFHSKYIAETGPTLLKYLKEVIPEPKPRSEKWFSTSAPQALRDDLKYALSSAEYHTNNFLGPVLFEEASRHIHPNAITIEIAPHGFLQAILSLSLNKDVLNIPLTHRNDKDSVQFLLNALGKLYEAGLNPHVASLYPSVPFPVSQGTPMLSHLVQWDHSEDWFVMAYESQEKKNYIERTVKKSVDEEKNRFFTQNVIGDDNLYPEAGYLALVWETLAMTLGQKYNELSVVFENVCFLKTIIIPNNGSLEFVVILNTTNGHFEIKEKDGVIATGLIYAKKNIAQEYCEMPPLNETTSTKTMCLLTKDFYKELRLRNYHYGELFRGIQECNVQCTRARISWFNNWITFLSSIMQLKIVGTDTRQILIPTKIERISIDTGKHYSDIFNMKLEDNASFEVVVDCAVDVTRAGGVEIHGYHLTPIIKHVLHDNPVLEKNVFIPNFGEEKMDIKDILRVHIQIIVENLLINHIKIMEVYDEEYQKNGLKPLLQIVGDIFNDMSLVRDELTLISNGHFKMPKNIAVKNITLSEKHNETSNLYIGANLLKRHDVLRQATATLRDKSFIISRETNRPDPKNYTDKYDFICIHDTGVEYLVLFRKSVSARPAKFIKILTSDDTYSWINNVKNHLGNGQKLVLYSQNEPNNGLLGLVNCLRREPTGEIVYGMLISDPSAPSFNPDLEIYKKQLEKDLAFNVYQNGQWGTYRHLLLENLETVCANHAYVNTVTIGDLSSLKWLEDPIRANHIFKNPEKILINVHCAALNFSDVMMAMGQLTVDAVTRGRLVQECLLGLEAAGKTKDGSRVMGIVRRGLSNLVEGDKELLWAIPDEWSFEQAATVPVAYSTVYYALVMVGKVQRGESILIHAGSSAVGQAAINVALHYGCEIFITIATAEKRTFIRKLFPQLIDNHIGNSNNISFTDMIKRETRGKGVDLVLNSLENDTLQASIDCLGSRGRFLNLNVYENSNNTTFSLSSFRKDISFHCLTQDFTQQPTELKIILQDLVQKGIESGAVHPLTFNVFGKHDIEAAFRFMEAGQQTGKVIIKIRDEYSTNDPETTDSMSIAAVPRYHCNEDHVYILVGGLGGFGLELTDWLILRGARNIVLVSRRGIVNGYQAYRLRTWASYGVKVHISTDDVSTEEGCEELLRTASGKGPVVAIFNLAVVLRDLLFQNQTPETFKITYTPKAVATLHLDRLSRKMCPQLKIFVVFSSLSCGRGNPGQTNYGFSNSVMERICEERKKLGLPALAVQWGPIGDVGTLEDAQHEEEHPKLQGYKRQKIMSCLSAFDMFLNQDTAVLSYSVIAEKKNTPVVAVKTVEDAIVKIMSIKGLKTISRQATLAELGLDSLMVVAIKHTLERDFKLYFSAEEIRALTFARLPELSTC